MGYFSKYRHHYIIPERISPEDARTRRLAATLAREQKIASDMPAAGLSRVKERTSFVPKWKLYDDPKVGHKAASIAAALATFKESDFANPEKRLAYRALRAKQEGLRNVKPPQADRRQFKPDATLYHTIYGTHARVGGSAHTLSSGKWLPSFLNPLSVIPCIDRLVRREVLFALGKSGRGYHTRKRRSYSSGIPC